jgi:hypothetical protein
MMKNYLEGKKREPGNEEVFRGRILK